MKQLKELKLNDTVLTADEVEQKINAAVSGVAPDGNLLCATTVCACTVCSGIVRANNMFVNNNGALTIGLGPQGQVTGPHLRVTKTQIETSGLNSRGNFAFTLAADKEIQVARIKEVREEIDAKLAEFTPSSGSGVSVDEFNGLKSQVAAKADKAHTHKVEDVGGLVATLGGKADAEHTHVIDDVAGLRCALDEKANVVHEHAVEDVDGLSVALDAKANAEHTHEISDVEGLGGALGAKADAAHTHGMGDVQGLSAAIDSLGESKADKVHTHEISDVTWLEDTLESKQDKIAESLSLHNVGDLDPTDENSMATAENCNQYFQIGTLADWGVNVDAVKLKRITLFRRGGGTLNGTANLWCRILRWDGASWIIAYQATQYQTFGSYMHNGQPIKITMEHRAGTEYIPSDERVLLCFVEGEDAPVDGPLVQFSAKSVAASVPMLAGSRTTLPPNADYQPAINFKLAAVIEAEVLVDIRAKLDDHSQQLTALEESLEGKQDKLTPGANISIVNGVISATGGSGGTADLTNYYTKTEVDKCVKDVKDEVLGEVAADYYCKTEIKNMVLENLPEHTHEISEVTGLEDALAGKQGKLKEGTNITIADDGTISAAGGSGGSVTVDAALSATSTNPIQNQWLGRRMGANEKNSVQIGYCAKVAAGDYCQILDIDKGTDDGHQVAVGAYAGGSYSGAAVGYGADGYYGGAAVGHNASGYTCGAAIGYDALGYTYGAAVGYNAKGNTYGVAIGFCANGSPCGVAVGHSACGRTYGVAVGYGALGYTYGVAVGESANGKSYGVAVGSDAVGSSYGVAVGLGANGADYKVAVGSGATATEDTPIVVGSSCATYSAAKITVSKTGVMTIGGNEVAMASALAALEARVAALEAQ
jgi:hypothetical protein